MKGTNSIKRWVNFQS